MKSFMKDFLLGAKHKLSEKKAIELLDKLPEGTISIVNNNPNEMGNLEKLSGRTIRPIGGSSSAPYIAIMDEGIVCHGYDSEINGESIMVTIPNGAIKVSPDNCGVDFEYKNQKYSIRAGILRRSENRYEWVPCSVWERSLVPMQQ